MKSDQNPGRVRLATVALLASVAVLAGCDAPTQTSSAASSSDAPVEAMALFELSDIVIDTSDFTGVTGRETTISSARLAADLERLLRDAPPATEFEFARLIVRPISLELVSPVAAAALSGPSQLTASYTLLDTRTNAVLRGPVAVTGRSDQLRLPGIAAVVTSPSVEDDYAQTLDAFARVLAAEVTAGAEVANPA